MDEHETGEPVPLVLGRNVRSRREQLGFSQALLAALMVTLGCTDWRPNTVANVERPDKPRALSLDEVGALCAALQCTVSDLLTAGAERTADRLMGRHLPDWAHEFDVDIARRKDQLRALNSHLTGRLFPDDPLLSNEWVQDAAMVLYGRDVLAERDARLAEQDETTSLGRAQRLGHITRQLIDELADFCNDDEGTET